MTIGYRADLELDLDALSEAVEERVRPVAERERRRVRRSPFAIELPSEFVRSAVSPGTQTDRPSLSQGAPPPASFQSQPKMARLTGPKTARTDAPRPDTADLLRDADGRSEPDRFALATVFRRAVLTTAPILLADLIGLSAAGMLGQLVLSWWFPAASSIVGDAAPFALLPLVIAYWLGELYAEIWVHPVVELRQLVHLTTVGLLAAAIAGVLAPPFPVWCAVAWLTTIVLLPPLRRIARRCCANCSWWGYPTLIIGAGDGADFVARVLLDVPTSGLRPVLLTDPAVGEAHSERSPGETRAAGGGAGGNMLLPTVHHRRDLESIVRSQQIRHAVVSLPELPAARLGETLNRYGGLVPHLLVLSDCSAIPTLWGASRNCGRLSGIEVRNGLLLSTLQALKRLLDVAVALATALLAAPLMVLIAVLIKLDSRGPILFGHTRIGRNGRRFRAWKFRTMRADGDAVLRRHLIHNPAAREEWEQHRKLRDDPRVTRLGRFLRRSSLDELPQVWNVLRGDMSLVGPRPIVDEEVARYGDLFRVYTSVKPGITGLWQVSGRTDTCYGDRVQLDAFYVRHWSPWLDIYVLAKTVVTLLTRNGAY